MSRMVTNVQFVGNLAAEPVARTGRRESGGVYVDFDVIVDAVGSDKDDAIASPTRHRVRAFGALARNVIASTHKGSRVVVVGTLQSTRWQDKATGETRYGYQVIAEVVGASLEFTPVTIHRRTTSTTDTPSGGSSPQSEE